MYDYIKGTLVKITAKHIVIETNGLGYIVTVANPYSFSDQMNQTIQVYLHQVIRDDAHLLFGFHTEDEKEVFLKLISVSGIGPTTALAIVAVDDNQGLVAAIDNSDIKYLMKFPKIGKKTAQQMVLDLAGKFAELPAETTNTTANQTAGNQQLEKKRQAFNRVFHNYDISRVAQFSLSELEEALQNPDVIRHKLKLEATVNNAKQVLKLQDEFGSLSHYFWHFFDGKPLINNVPTYKDVPSLTDLSKQIAKDLKKRGFKFLGPTTMYSFLQAAGFVNDHENDCSFK